jgi:hypothetical protein
MAAIFHDSYYYYRLTQQYSESKSRKKGTGWFSQSRHYKAGPAHHTSTTSSQSNSERAYVANHVGQAERTTSKRKRKVQMSQTTILDLDPQRRSDRAEVAILHSDIIHNPYNALVLRAMNRRSSDKG